MKNTLFPIVLLSVVSIFWTSCKDEDAKEGDTIINQTIVQENDNPLMGKWNYNVPGLNYEVAYFDFGEDMSLDVAARDSNGIEVSLKYGTYSYLGPGLIFLNLGGTPDTYNYEFNTDSSGFYLWSTSDDPRDAFFFDQFTGSEIVAEEIAVTEMYSLPEHVEFSEFGTFSAKGNNWSIPLEDDNKIYNFNINTNTFTDSFDVSPATYHSVIKGSTNLYAIRNFGQEVFELDNTGSISSTSNPIPSGSIRNIFEGASGIEVFNSNAIYSFNGMDFTLEFEVNSNIGFDDVLYLGGKYWLISKDGYCISGISTNPVRGEVSYTLPQGYTYLGYGTDGTNLYFVGNSKFERQQKIFKVELP